MAADAGEEGDLLAGKRRDRGDGSIFWREDRKRWIGQLDLGVDDSGTRLRRLVSGDTKEEVKAQLDELRDARRRGVNLAAHDVTFHEIAQLWLARDLDERVGELTRQNYRILLEGHISRAIGRRKIVDLRADDIETMLLSIQELGRSARYLRLALNLTQRVLDYAMRRDIVLRNVADRVRAPAGPTAERHGLTVKQARSVLDAAGKYRIGTLVVTALLLGLRPGEVAGLTWANLELEGDRPTVTVSGSLRRTTSGAMVLAPPKTPSSRRTLDLPPPLVTALTSQRHQQKAERRAAGHAWSNSYDLVFTTEVGTPLDPSNVRRTMNLIARDAGIERLHPHMLRHAAASLLSAAGVPLEDISDTLGHRSISTTADIYRHPIAPIRSGHVATMTSLASGSSGSSGAGPSSPPP